MHGPWRVLLRGDATHSTQSLSRSYLTVSPLAYRQCTDFALFYGGPATSIVFLGVYVLAVRNSCCVASYFERGTTSVPRPDWLDRSVWAGAASVAILWKNSDLLGLGTRCAPSLPKAGCLLPRCQPMHCPHGTRN